MLIKTKKKLHTSNIFSVNKQDNKQKMFRSRIIYASKVNDASSPYEKIILSRRQAKTLKKPLATHHHNINKISKMSTWKVFLYDNDKSNNNLQKINNKKNHQLLKKP